MELNNYPKVKVLLTQKIKEVLNKIAPSEEEISKEMLEGLVNSTYAGVNRNLYDIFDEYDIQIGIQPSEGNNFTSVLHVSFLAQEYFTKKTRKEVEEEVFNKAIELLENKL